MGQAIAGPVDIAHPSPAYSHKRGHSKILDASTIPSSPCREKIPIAVLIRQKEKAGESSSKSGVTQLETEPGIVDTIVERLLPIRYSGPWSLSAEVDERLAGSNAFVGA